MSPAEIAQVLSIQEQVVRNQLSSALKKIREQLVKII
jgi:DNA-directed RNA polymerase specialized sigma24 family protein